MFKTCRLDQEKGRATLQAMQSNSLKPRARLPAPDTSEVPSLDVQSGDLVRELARERQLRLEAECTARDLRIECDRFKVKIQESQKSYDRIHVALEKLRQYRHQIDSLQQEKDLQQQRYEGNLSRLREQIKMLESQKATLQMQLEEQRFRPPVDGNRERSQLLLRIARLERGNSQLMDDLTAQRQQFDNCLDKFASQVTQALMEQKGLKRENDELHRRNGELQRMISRLESRLNRSSQDSGVGSMNGVRHELLAHRSSEPPQPHRQLPVSEKLPRRALLAPPRPPPSQLRFRGSSDDIRGSSAKMTSPVGLPLHMSPASGGALAMRRVRSDNTPCQVDRDSSLDDAISPTQLMHRAESCESLSSECSDIPIVNYWEMYQERQQRTAIPEILRQRNCIEAGDGDRGGQYASPMSDAQFAANVRELRNESKLGSESPNGLQAPREVPARAQSVTDLSDPLTRATMLDAMLGSQSDDEDTSDPSGGAHIGSAITPASRDELEYLRCIRRRNMEALPQHTSIIEFSEHRGFLRYGEDERDAIQEFEFLRDMLSDSESFVTDVESSGDEEARHVANLSSLNKAETSFALIPEDGPSPRRSLSSERVGHLPNGRLETFDVGLSFGSQPNISRTANREKKVSRTSAKLEHTTSLTTVIENVHSRVTRSSPRRTSPSPLSFSTRQRASNSPSPSVSSPGAVSYGVTIRDNQAAHRLSLSAIPGGKAPGITPVNTPDPPRRSSSRSTLI